MVKKCPMSATRLVVLKNEQRFAIFNKCILNNNRFLPDGGFSPDFHVLKIGLIPTLTLPFKRPLHFLGKSETLFSLYKYLNKNTCICELSDSCQLEFECSLNFGILIVWLQKCSSLENSGLVTIIAPFIPSSIKFQLIILQYIILSLQKMSIFFSFIYLKKKSHDHISSLRKLETLSAENKFNPLTGNFQRNLTP